MKKSEATRAVIDAFDDRPIVFSTGYIGRIAHLDDGEYDSTGGQPGPVSVHRLPDTFERLREYLSSGRPQLGTGVRA